MTRILSLFGLMRVSEHERSVRALESQLVLRESAFETIEADRDRISDKFKRAATDLAAQAEEIAALKRSLAESEMLSHSLDAERNEQAALIAALRPDAEAMRKKRDADRKRMAGKRGKGQ